MTESEITEILKSLDAAPAVFENHRGRPTIMAVSVKSMLTTSRARLMAELQRIQDAIEQANRPRG